MQFNPVIAIPAFNRPESLQRLLSSLDASIHDGRPELVISLEGGAPAETGAIARRFAGSCQGFNVQVREQSRRIGLREHILSLGDLALEHGSVVVVEDDLFLDPQAYRFAQASLGAYADDPRVAGHALYSPRFHEFARLTFEPLANGFSTYCMELPCSWGQAWSGEQWGAFRDWLKTASEDKLAADDRLPRSIRQWPESSWKKLFAHYLVDTGRVFTYPYQSYSTNFTSPSGTHTTASSHLLQVPMADPARGADAWTFVPPGDGRVMYDAYMEPAGSFVHDALGLPEGEVEIDLYGTKPLALLKRKPLVLTSRRVSRAVRRFPMLMRPIEQNLRIEALASERAALALANSADVTEEGPELSVEMLQYRSGMMPLSRVLLWRLLSYHRPRFRPR